MFAALKMMFVLVLSAVAHSPVVSEIDAKQLLDDARKYQANSERTNADRVFEVSDGKGKGGDSPFFTHDGKSIFFTHRVVAGRGTIATNLEAKILAAGGKAAGLMIGRDEGSWGRAAYTLSQPYAMLESEAWSISPVSFLPEEKRSQNLNRIYTNAMHLANAVKITQDKEKMNLLKAEILKVMTKKDLDPACRTKSVVDTVFQNFPTWKEWKSVVCEAVKLGSEKKSTPAEHFLLVEDRTGDDPQRRQAVIVAEEVDVAVGLGFGRRSGIFDEDNLTDKKTDFTKLDSLEFRRADGEFAKKGVNGNDFMLEEPNPVAQRAQSTPVILNVGSGGNATAVARKALVGDDTNGQAFLSEAANARKEGRQPAPFNSTVVWVSRQPNFDDAGGGELAKQVVSFVQHKAVSLNNTEAYVNDEGENVAIFQPFFEDMAMADRKSGEIETLLKPTNIISNLTPGGPQNISLQGLKNLLLATKKEFLVRQLLGGQRSRLEFQQLPHGLEIDFTYTAKAGGNGSGSFPAKGTSAYNSSNGVEFEDYIYFDPSGHGILLRRIYKFDQAVWAIGQDSSDLKKQFLPSGKATWKIALGMVSKLDPSKFEPGEPKNIDEELPKKDVGTPLYAFVEGYENMRVWGAAQSALCPWNLWAANEEGYLRRQYLAGGKATADGEWPGVMPPTMAQISVYTAMQQQARLPSVNVNVDFPSTVTAFALGCPSPDCANRGTNCKETCASNPKCAEKIRGFQAEIQTIKENKENFPAGVDPVSLGDMLRVTQRQDFLAAPESSMSLGQVLQHRVAGSTDLVCRPLDAPQQETLGTAGPGVQKGEGAPRQQVMGAP